MRIRHRNNKSSKRSKRFKFSALDAWNASQWPSTCLHIDFECKSDAPDAQNAFVNTPLLFRWKTFFVCKYVAFLASCLIISNNLLDLKCLFLSQAFFWSYWPRSQLTWRIFISIYFNPCPDFLPRGPLLNLMQKPSTINSQLSPALV